MRPTLPLAVVLVLVWFSSPASGATLDPRVEFLLHQRDRGKTRLDASDLPVSIRFHRPPTDATLQALQSLGVRWSTVKLSDAPAKGPARRWDGEWLLGSDTILSGRVPWDTVRELAARPEVARVETSWSPSRHRPLNNTRMLSGAEDAWTLQDAQQQALLGTGVLICDLDTGVDHFHPDLWARDGPIYDWIDVDLSGDFTSGDAVDLDGSTTADAGETLRWMNAPGTAPGLDPSLQLHIDYLYNDANDDGDRDVEIGFVEADPTHGELIFHALDTDLNGQLDPGEQVQALSTSKVRAAFNLDGTVYRAGVDLIGQEGDLFGHGTNVCSILAGGEVGRRFAGLAPGARLVHATLDYAGTSETPMEARMSWGAAEGADIMVYEIGGWVWEYLDGSSNVELLMNQHTAQGILNVVAAGNLNIGSMHWEGSLGVGVGDSLVAELNTPVGLGITEIYGDFYAIPGPGDVVTLELTTPAGDTVVLTGDGNTDVVGEVDIWHLTSTSVRGTERRDWMMSLNEDAVATELGGTWRFVLRRTAPAKRGAAALPWFGMVVDDISGWFGNTTWVHPVGNNTVTWPATADEAVVVGGYNPSLSTINNFSGRGTRVDGMDLIDLTAPGSTTYTGLRREATGFVPGGYGGFGGTSAATPHVAAAAAILMQFDPTAPPAEIEWLLKQGAVEDAFTGSTPNPTWGEGKLQVHESLWTVLVPVPAAIGTGGPVLLPNRPNPFNPATTFPFTLARAGRVEVRVFDLRGRRVREIALGTLAAGAHTQEWDGTDDLGVPVASGVYLVQVDLDGQRAHRKISLLK